MTQVEATYTGLFETHVTDDAGHELVTCAPVGSSAFPGASGVGVSPTDLFAEAIASCILTMMGMRAHKLGVDITGTRVRIQKTMMTTPPYRIGRLEIEVISPHTFDAEITEKLEHEGSHCPVHKSIHPDIECPMSFTWGAQN